MSLFRSGAYFCAILPFLLSGSISSAPCPPPPNVTLFYLDSDSDPVGTIGLTKLSFNVTQTSKSSFLLICNHSSPIRWVLDEDKTLGEISEPGASYTSRTFLDFLDPSTYAYTAHYYIALSHPSKDHVFICEPFLQGQGSPKPGNVSGCVTRSVVLAELQYTLQASQTKKLQVEILSKEEVSKVVPPLREFDTQRSKQGQGSEVTPTNSTNQTCPFTLTLAVDEVRKDIYFQWDAGNFIGQENVHMITTIQSMENFNRFQPQLEESCVSFVEVDNITNKNKVLEPRVHKFFPYAFVYTNGKERRTLKTFFDLSDALNFYYSWEPVDPKDMIFGKVKPKEIYKGQNFTVICSPSVYLYSQGTQITWNFSEMNSTSENGIGKMSGRILSSDFLDKEDFADAGGTYEVKGSLSFSRDFLLENDLHEVELKCVSPLWNSPEWVNYSFKVVLKDSELPKIISDEIESILDTNFTQILTPTMIRLEGTEKNFTLSCEAGGIPLPTLEFIPPKNNLEFIQLEPEITENGTIIARLQFPNISSQIVGDYICLAKSPVGEDRKLFRLSLKSPLLPPFVILILWIGGAVVLISILIITGLLIRLRKERVQFLLETQEAIRKFQEGFSATSDLGFKSKSEYKEYEIPLNRWGLGNTLLGSGAFGVVQKGVIYYGENRQDVVAVKTVQSPKDVVEFENSLLELTIMSYIGKHEHIVSLVGACTDNMSKRSILIGVEYCANGDLLNYLQKRRALFRSFVGAEDGIVSLESICGRDSYANFANSGNFTSLDLYKWGFQIANGMDFLTSKKILHADLAARNVLLTKDNICKISDFGLSRQLLMSDNYTKKTNTPLPWRWMAIESLKYRQFSSASDIWSFGVTLFEIFSLGEEPWPGLGWTNEFQDELDRGMRLARPKFSTHNMYNKIMLECWRLEPEARITFAQAREFFETAISNLTSPEGQDEEMLNSVC